MSFYILLKKEIKRIKKCSLPTPLIDGKTVEIEVIPRKLSVSLG
jgi:hypothetical protein